MSATRKDPTRSAGGPPFTPGGVLPPDDTAPLSSEGRASGHLDTARVAVAEVLERCGLNDHDRAELGRTLAMLTRLAHRVEAHLHPERP